MVDKVVGNGTSGIENGQLFQLRQQRSLEEISANKADKPEALQELTDLSFEDEATVSSEARLRLAKELELAKYTKMAQQAEEPIDPARAEKVAALRQMVQSNKISEYLRTIDTDAMVKKMLEDGPFGAYLSK